MKTPTIYLATNLNAAFNNGLSAGLADGRWVPVRPEPWRGLMLCRRAKAAWLAFTGQADVVLWDGQS